MGQVQCVVFSWRERENTFRACLELIGRTRCFGIEFPNDETLGRFRILLTAKKLITQYQQTANTFIIHYIRRFSKYNLESYGVAHKGGQTKDTKEQIVSTHGDEDDNNCSDSDNDNVEINTDATVRASCCDPALMKTCNFLKMVYDTIASSNGCSRADICRKLRLPKSHIRSHLNHLANTGLIESYYDVTATKRTRIFQARHSRSKQSRHARRAKKSSDGSSNVPTLSGGRGIA